MAATPNQCIYSGCENAERLLIPSVVKELLWLHYKIYIPLTARICNFHANSHLWNDLVALYSDFTGHQMDNIMSIVERAMERKLDFTDFYHIDPKMCQFCLGFNVEQLQELLSLIPSLHEKVLSAFLALRMTFFTVRK